MTAAKLPRTCERWWKLAILGVASMLLVAAPRASAQEPALQPGDVRFWDGAYVAESRGGLPALGDYFFADPSARDENAAVVRIGREILDEDRAICEIVQRNLESGVYDTGVLSPRHENGLRAFHDWLRESYADG